MTSLLKRCRDGDERAWHELVAQYERLVYSVALSNGLHRDEAGDVAQTVFSALLDGLDSIYDEDRLASWLATVTRRHSWRYRQQRERIGPGSEDVAESTDRTGDHDVHIGQWEAAHTIELGLAALDERGAALIRALYLDPASPSYEEISAQLGIPVGSIGPTRARYLAKLRDHIGPIDIR